MRTILKKISVKECPNSTIQVRTPHGKNINTSGDSFNLQNLEKENIKAVARSIGLIIFFLFGHNIYCNRIVIYPPKIVIFKNENAVPEFSHNMVLLLISEWGKHIFNASKTQICTFSNKRNVVLQYILLECD